MTEHRNAIDARRDAAIDALLRTARAALAAATDELDALQRIETALQEVAGDAALFPDETFPRPAETDNRDYLLHQDQDGGFSLYLSMGKPGATSGPHDHGGTWASIAAVEGAEHHGFFTADEGRLRQVGAAVCEPGTAVSVPTGGIHSIEPGPDHFVHLHLYGLGFDHQGVRRVFDPETGHERQIKLDDFSWIEDRRRGA